MQYIIETRRRMLGEGRVGNRKFDKVNWQKIWHSDIFSGSLMLPVDIVLLEQNILNAVSNL